MSSEATRARVIRRAAKTPWRYEQGQEGRFVCSADGTIVAAVRLDGLDAQAAGDLLAAAPALRDACEAALAILDALPDFLLRQKRRTRVRLQLQAALAQVTAAAADWQAVGVVCRGCLHVTPVGEAIKDDDEWFCLTCHSGERAAMPAD